MHTIKTNDFSIFEEVIINIKNNNYVTTCKVALVKWH